MIPDEPVYYERFQWLAKEIVDNGGEVALVRVKDIEGMPNAAVVAIFNDARGRDYDEIAEPLTLLIKDTKSRKASTETITSRLQRLRHRFQEIYEIDFFQSSRGQDVGRLFRQAESLALNKRGPERKVRLRTEDYQGKTWITRPRPEIDRVAIPYRRNNDSGRQGKFFTKAQFLDD
jgi:hypothetical protein